MVPLSLSRWQRDLEIVKEFAQDGERQIARPTRILNTAQAPRVPSLWKPPTHSSIEACQYVPDRR
jgi:hypothetical protein